MTLRSIIIDFMKGVGGVATLGQIYEAIDGSDYSSSSDTVHDSARAVIYRNTSDFRRVCKGVYMLAGENAAAENRLFRRLGDIAAPRNGLRVRGRRSATGIEGDGERSGLVRRRRIASRQQEGGQEGQNKESSVHICKC